MRALLLAIVLMGCYESHAVEVSDDAGLDVFAEPEGCTCCHAPGVPS